MHAWNGVLAAAVMAVLTAALACTTNDTGSRGDSDASTSQAVVFLQWPGDRSFAESSAALPRPNPPLRGELEIDAGCLQLRRGDTLARQELNEQGRAHPSGVWLLIWPPEYSYEVTPDGITVVDGGGSAIGATGEVIAATGMSLAAMSDLNAFTDHQRAEACHGPLTAPLVDDVWLVTAVVAE